LFCALLQQSIPGGVYLNGAPPVVYGDFLKAINVVAISVSRFAQLPPALRLYPNHTVRTDMCERPHCVPRTAEAELNRTATPFTGHHELRFPR